MSSLTVSEKLLRLFGKILLPGLVLILGFVVVRDLILRQGMVTGWTASELLINYAGGFVRRGLIGSLFAQSATPLATVTATQTLLVILLFAGVAWLIATEKSTALRFAAFSLIFFSPGGLFELAADDSWSYFGRKEIWFYVVALFVIASAMRFSQKPWALIAVMATSSVAMILHHELFFFFFSLPQFVLLYCFLQKEDFRRRVQLLSFFVAPSIAALAAVVLNPGGEQTSQRILNSYEGSDAEGLSGAIGALSWQLSDSHALSIRLAQEGSFTYWLFFVVIAVLLAAIYLIALAASGGNIFAPLVLLALGLFAMAIAMYSGWDWGRWISILTVSFYLNLRLQFELSAGASLPRELTSKSYSSPKEFFLAVAFLFLTIFSGVVALLSQMQHCCSQPLGAIALIRVPVSVASLLSFFS